MNGINRRSQKIVCVDAMWSTYLDNDPKLSGATVPKLHDVVTVDNFMPCPACSHHHFLTLVEHPNPQAGGIAFRIDCFRPLVDRKTDIGVLVEAGKRVEARSPVSGVKHFTE
jgi:hypothetical protein